jgi:hypothetical protein
MRARFILIIIILLIIIGAGWLFISDKRRQALYNAEITPTHIESISDVMIGEALNNSNFANTHFGGQVFLAYQKLGEETSGAHATEYVWLVSQEFYVKNGKLLKGSGVSLPLALFYDNGNLVAVNAPRDGSNYTKDVQSIFPDSIKQLPIFTDVARHDEIVSGLEQQVQTKAHSQFGSLIQTTETPLATSTGTSTTATTTNP